MNKKILLTLFLVLAVALSVSTIYAGDVNVTDSYTSISQDGSAPLGEDPSSQDVFESNVDNDMSNDVLKSENSSTLSTNTEESDISESDDNAQSTTIDDSKTITSKSVTKYYKGSEKYTATFLDKNGTPLSKATVEISVNGKTYKRTTDSEGVASLDINLKPGTYKVSATNPVSGYKLTTTFKILDTIKASGMTKVYRDGKKFTATFLNSNGKALANKNIKFRINGKTYTKKTNSKGVASLSLTNLKKGTYKIVSYNADGLTKTNTVKVIKTSKTKLTASDYTFLKSDTKVIKVELLNQLGYAPAKGKVIKFTVNGKKYNVKTDSKGIAKLKLPSLASKVYTVSYKFDGDSVYKASSTKSKVTVIPTKNPTFTVKSTTNFGYGANTAFKLALTSGNVPLAGHKVTLNLNNKDYTLTTDKNGVVSIKIKLKIGKYNVTYTNKATSKTVSKTGETAIKVFERTPSKLTWKSGTSFNQGIRNVKVLALNSKNKPIAKENIKLKVGSKTFTAKTGTDGYATFKVNFGPGKYNVTFTYSGDNSNAPATSTKALSVKKVTKVSIKSIISASRTVKSYYAAHKKVPSTVVCANLEFTAPEFLYLMSKAIEQLGKSNKKDISIINGVSKPSSPSGDSIDSRELYKAKYLTVAKNVASFINNHKQAPNYASSAVGKIIYGELVDSFARILAFYGDNDNYLPNYVTVKYGSSGYSSSGTGLNEKNTIKDLSVYLKASSHCQVDNSKIKSLVSSLTKGLKTDSDKARAIFNYVRDHISYSFYYDTKYGAVGTYNAKAGNCVDHSHLLVAMFRTADLPARYVHGTCKFSSGSTYGHVWTQVLVNNKWTVADATSSRNSLGSIANWNTNSYSLNAKYASLPF